MKFVNANKREVYPLEFNFNGVEVYTNANAPNAFYVSTTFDLLSGTPYVISFWYRTPTFFTSTTATNILNHNIIKLFCTNCGTFQPNLLIINKS